MITFEITATDNRVSVTAVVPTTDEAKTVAAQFPKSVGVKPRSLHTRERALVGYLIFEAKLSEDGVNGGRNEAGVRRYRSLRKHIARLGYAVEYSARYANSYPTLEAFEATL